MKKKKGNKITAIENDIGYYMLKQYVNTVSVPLFSFSSDTFMEILSIIY